jgi:predicted nucleotidyltransferase
MNIHFTDIELFKQLKSATMAKVVVGSTMYGTNTKDSDIDYLYIYATSENELLSTIKTNHQLQFIDENGNDHNFVSLHSFIQNILNGDSTINFEVIQSNELFTTHLDWLANHKKSFITYTVIKSYLGLCKRDLKHYYKADTDYLKKKRLGHIIRGYVYANAMIYNNWDFTLVNLEFKNKFDNLDITNNNTLKDFDSGISFLRDELNEKLNTKTLGLAQFMHLEDSTEFTNDLLSFCKSVYFKQKQTHLKDFNLDLYLNAYENWVDYAKN